ncbi:hypothetical protein SAMN02745192_0603 [Xylanibacter ruminicola]|nr:hypothetical protein SAMN02745192_0603 [Xylanibacter ruminicola]
MPTMKEKLAFEQQNENTIRLWPEGGFYRAFERSAYLFVNHVRQYEVRRKFVKVVGSDVVDIGFPKLVLHRLGHEIEDCRDGCKTIKIDSSIDEQSFQIWRSSVPQGVVRQPTVPVYPELQPPVAKGPVEHDVAERIRQLNMASMTPMQCMVLLAELQNVLIK